MFAGLAAPLEVFVEVSTVRIKGGSTSPRKGCQGTMDRVARKMLHIAVQFYRRHSHCIRKRGIQPNVANLSFIFLVDQNTHS